MSAVIGRNQDSAIELSATTAMGAVTELTFADQRLHCHRDRVDRYLDTPWGIRRGGHRGG